MFNRNSAENYIILHQRLSLHPKVRIPTVVNTIICKLHLIHEQNVQKNLQPQLETCTKLYMDGVTQ